METQIWLQGVRVLPDDNPADFKQKFVRLENGHCRIKFFAIFFRSILVVNVKIGFYWFGNYGIDQTKDEGLRKLYDID
jgi:hypothetical protein